jgi:hypothetical protein
MICNCLWPILQGQHQQQRSSALIIFIYLASFGAHFGAQIWMTFISGLALYFSLPRHTFGKCQEILFPKYFLLNTILSCATLITFAKFDAANFNSLRWTLQIIALTLCVAIEMIIYLYLTPILLHFMKLKYHFEGKLGNGQEIGHQGEFNGIRDPMYSEINGKFRKAHIKCAIGNIITICCSFFHLFYLTSKIQITSS